MSNEKYLRSVTPGVEKRLQSYIYGRKLTGLELSKLLGISPNTVSNVLTGKHKPSTKVLHKLSQSFEDFNINWVLYGEEQQPQKHDSVTHTVTPPNFKSGVTESNTTAIQAPPPPPPPPPGTSNEEILSMLEQYRQRVETQDKTIAFLQTHVGQLTEQNKMLTELIKMGKFNAVTFTGPQEYPLYTINNGNSVTLAVTAKRKVA